MSALDGSHPKSISLSMSLGLLNGLHAMKCGTRLYFKKKKKKSDAIRNTALLDGERRNKSRHLSVGRNGIWTFEPQSSFIPFFFICRLCWSGWIVGRNLPGFPRSLPSFSPESGFCFVFFANIFGRFGNRGRAVFNSGKQPLPSPQPESSKRER